MATVRSLVSWAGNAALDLLFPPRCAACGRGGALLCATCEGGLVPAVPPRCSRCWRPLAAGACRECQLAPPAFERLRAAYINQGPARELVHALKFRGVSAVAPRMASLLADAVRAYELDADVIVPVPLGGRRRRSRGYNQAELLARSLARELTLPFEAAALIRRRQTPPQTQRRDAEARRRNVAGAFEARARFAADRRVLVVDDVTTTGATLEACASALKQAGARAVWALAFARED